MVHTASAVLSGWARACSYTIHARRTTRCRLTSGAVLRGLVMLRVRAMAPDTRLPWAQKRRSRQAPCSAPVAQRSWSPDIAVGKRARRTSARRVCYRQTALPIVVTEGCYSCVFLQLQRQQLSQNTRCPAGTFVYKGPRGLRKMEGGPKQPKSLGTPPEGR